MALKKLGGLVTASSPIPVSEIPESKKALVPTGGGKLLEVLAAIRKAKGQQVIVLGHQIPTVRRLPTGIFEFDFYIGGGFPCGRYSIVYGPESSCKTNLCLKAVATAQRLPVPCNKAIWVDVEHSFDPIWAAKMGVKVEDLLVVNAGYGEEAVDLIDALVRAEDVAILVVDSVAALIASKEIAQSVEKYDIGTSALLIKRMVNKLMVAFSEEQKRNHDPCVILINQTRFKPGVLFGDPETMPGGEAQKFLSSLRVRVRAANIVDKESNLLTFKEVHASIKKSKVPVRAATFEFSLCVTPTETLGVGDTESFSMVKGHLQALNLLDKKGQAWRVKFGGEVGSFMYPTLSVIQDKYYADALFRSQLQQLVLDSYVQPMLVVDEIDHSPVDVPPGASEPVQSVAKVG